jgi:hypothetical protein
MAKQRMFVEYSCHLCLAKNVRVYIREREEIESVTAYMQYVAGEVQKDHNGVIILGRRVACPAQKVDLRLPMFNEKLGIGRL